MCFWFGVLVVLFALFATRGEIIALGFVMFFLHDEFMKNMISKYAPNLSKWIQEFTDEL